MPPETYQYQDRRTTRQGFQINTPDSGLTRTGMSSIATATQEKRNGRPAYIAKYAQYPDTWPSVG
ncbi:hypothetical protein IFR05_013576 [Cadophora sp. M221]|nr:hypothetical protein IFR05_013576 [Cadophora sp. M221]